MKGPPTRAGLSGICGVRGAPRGYKVNAGRSDWLHCRNRRYRARSSDVVVLRRAGHHFLGNRVGARTDRALQPVGHFGVFLEELLGVLAALADPDAVIAEPCARFLDEAGLDAEVKDFADLRDTLTVHDVELDLLERRRDLVLDDLHASRVADDIVAVLDLPRAADVEADARVELARIAAGRGLRIAVHYADLPAQLVDEDHHAARAADRAGQLAKRLRHKASLQPAMAVAHLTLDIGAGHLRRDRIAHQHVDRVRPHQGIDDLARLLASIGQRHDELVAVAPELLGIDRVARLLGLDDRGSAAILLRFGDDVHSERGLARAFWPVHFDHAATRQPADPERDVEHEAPGRDRLDLHRFLRAQLHRRALAERAIDLRQRGLARLGALAGSLVGAQCHRIIDDLQRCRHWEPPSPNANHVRVNREGVRI